MPGTDINALLKFANKLADKSGDKIRKHFRKLDNIDSKHDASPVTIADREAEEILRKLIIKQYPEHGIHGEEFGVHNPDAKYKWIIDPIDGTVSFMIGRPIFGTMIGLLVDGKPLLGLIDQPVIKERWLAAKGQGTKLNKKPCRTREADLKNAVLCTTGPNYLPGEKLGKFNQVAAKARYTVYGGDCYNYALLAMGKVDLVIESGLKPHDFLPLIPIITEAGGVITNWQGNALDEFSDGDVVVAGCSKLHKDVISILKEE